MKNFIDLNMWNYKIWPCSFQLSSGNQI